MRFGDKNIKSHIQSERAFEARLYGYDGRIAVFECSFLGVFPVVNCMQEM